LTKNNRLKKSWFKISCLSGPVKMIDVKNGGFYRQISGNDMLIPDADKGGILNTRMLWVFSSASE
jgi:hypothetical protein